MPRIFSLSFRAIKPIEVSSHKNPTKTPKQTPDFPKQTPMATARFLRASKPLRRLPSPAASSSSVTAVKCCACKAGMNGEKVVCGDGEKTKPAVPAKAFMAVASDRSIAADPQANRGLDLASFLATIKSGLINVVLRSAVKRKPLNFQVQMLIETAIINCRFFTFFAVVGSLIGSVLCFLEGCFLILKSYFHCFNILSRTLGQGHMVLLLIEAIDMFLVGTAMLIFGVGLYAIFVGSKNPNEKGPWLPASNLFGLFRLESVPTWVEMRSVSQAKSRIGHAVMLILQVGLLEKFKEIPLVTSLDLACFAAAVLVSSASIFLLSRLSDADANIVENRW